MKATENKLQKILKLADAESGEASSTPYRTVKDKFAGMTKRDGSIDTLKVKSSLQQQYKLQNQVNGIFVYKNSLAKL